MSASITSGTYPRAAQPASGTHPRLGSSLWQFLVRAGARRAYPEMMRLARLREHSDPALAQQLRDAARNMLQG